MVKATKKPRITCEAAAIFSLGGGITEEDAEITGSWLLTNKQVIGCYMFHRQEETFEPPTKQTETMPKLF